MKKISFTLVLSVLVLIYSPAQEPLDYFLPSEINYNPDIPTPEEFFNQQLGEWHITHDQLLYYMKEIAEVSDRAIIQEYARSYENRPLIYIIFTSEKNHRNLEELKKLHVKFSDPAENISIKDVPLIVTMGYGVHGNESSGPNSSVLTAYYLAAAQGEKIDRLLDNAIILVDPCLNPDGFTRHSTWANMHQSATDMPYPDSRQFHEVWPGGRTNHYWFDLNRDYLLLVHPESKGRIAKFHEWKPNIYNDHHEMGADHTFFFQPGIPTRNNPWTPEENYVLTGKISKYHADFLNNIGSAYFTEEMFDDYYIGKGSSYPDVNGCIGILYEQAGFRGRIRETVNGVKKLSFGIRNQFTVTLSTLEAAIDLKDELLRFQKDFYINALALAEDDQVKAYVFSNENQKEKALMFIELLNQHQIKVYKNEKEISLENKTFKPKSSFVVPVKQPQYRLIKSLFQVTTTFTDSAFYDVSTWTLPYAFNIPYAAANSVKNLHFNDNHVEPKSLEGKIIGGRSQLAYLFRWDEYSAPKALYHIQKEGLITKAATKKFSFTINGSEEDFTYGTILIPAAGQIIEEGAIYGKVSEVARKTGIDFYGLETGLSSGGIDLGSSSFIPLSKPEVLMLVGRGTGSADAGEIWHMFDQRYQIPVCLTESANLSGVSLNRYNLLILPPGSYRELTGRDIEKIRRWTEQGGILIAVKNAAAWATRNKLGKTEFKKSAQPDSTVQVNYAGRSKQQSLNVIGGAIVNSEMDITHPLCYGYQQKELPIFKRGTSVAKTLNINFSEPVKFTVDPYISGFISDKNLERIKNAPVVSVQSVGRGKLISYHESMTFRGFWLGTNKLFMNSVFFGSVIR